MDFREIGKHLPRTKWGEGWVDKRGKRRKVWVGFWYVYVLGGGKERRRVREKVLGTVKEIGDSRPAAMAKLRQVRALVEGTLAPAPDNQTIAELWDRYCAIKSERWSKAMEGSLVSTFKTCVLPAIGKTRAQAATASQLQGLLNALAKSQRSHSAIKKARTHLKAMFELAVDDKILDASPARRITMPKRIRKVDDTYADRTTVRALFDAADRRDRIILRLFVICHLRSAPARNVRPPCQRYRARATPRGRGLEAGRTGFRVCGRAENGRFLRVCVTPGQARSGTTDVGVR